MTQQPDDTRVHDCLYGYCPKRSDECRRCDGVVAIIRRALINSSRFAYDIDEQITDRGTK